MNQFRCHKNQRFTQKRLCCQCCGIIKGFCTKNKKKQKPTINSNVNNSPNSAMQFKKSGQIWQIVRVLFSSNNEKPHTFLVTRQKLLELGWNELSHPPFNPDLALLDYHLFISMQNSLNGKMFNKPDDIKSHLIQFFVGRNQNFYEHVIMTLPQKWQKKNKT